VVAERGLQQAQPVEQGCRQAFVLARQVERQQVLPVRVDGGLSRAAAPGALVQGETPELMDLGLFR
jgi:hypothetical protein